MAYKDNQRELKQAAQRMENHAEDLHPELNWKDAPKGPSGSIKSYPWTESADIFVEQKRKRER